jgi:Protein of unknown function (DUF3618)
MSQTPDQIESTIDRTRANLHSNVQELEDKVKSVTDWRQLFAKSPGAMTAAAFGAGALLATLIRTRKSSTAGAQAFAPARSPLNGHSEPAQPKPQALETWDLIKNAVVGVAATKITGYLGELMPGFEEQLRKSQRSDDNPPATSPGSVM